MFPHTIPWPCSPPISSLGAITVLLGGRNVARILLLVLLLLLFLFSSAIIIDFDPALTLTPSLAPTKVSSLALTYGSSSTSFSDPANHIISAPSPIVASFPASLLSVLLLLLLINLLPQLQTTASQSKLNSRLYSYTSSANRVTEWSDISCGSFSQLRRISKGSRPSRCGGGNNCYKIVCCMDAWFTALRWSLSK